MNKGSSHPFKKKLLKKRIILVSVAVASFCVIVLGFSLYLNSQKTGILILEGNSQLTVSLNGRVVDTKEITTRGLFIPVYSGSYKLQIEKANFQPFTLDVTTRPGEIAEIRPLFTLVPNLRETAGDSVDYVQPSFDQKYVYYLGDFRERLYRYDVVNQQSIALTREPLRGVKDVLWGSSPEVALIVQQDGVYLHEIPTFDFKNQIFQKVAGNEVFSPVWDTQNQDRIAAAYYTPAGESSLILSDKRFTTIKRLQSLAELPKVSVSWSPDGNFLLLRGVGTETSSNNLWRYTLADGSFTQLTTTGGITQAHISPDSLKVLVTSVDASGSKRIILNLSDLSTSPINSSSNTSAITWRDGSSFYEAQLDGSLRLTTLSGATTNFMLNLPNPELITAIFAFTEKQRVVIATETSVYSVDLAP